MICGSYWKSCPQIVQIKKDCCSTGKRVTTESTEGTEKGLLLYGKGYPQIVGIKRDLKRLLYGKNNLIIKGNVGSALPVTA